MTVEVLDDKDAVAERAAAILAGASGHVALAGGSTPKQAYALAAQQRSDWRGVTFWLGDERHVPTTDERSNARMVREHFLTSIPRATLPLFEPVDTELDLEASAADYDRRLRAALGDDGRLDLVLLGLGPDSHTASLFPGMPAVDIRDRLVAPVPEAGLEPFVPRVTLTLTALNAARSVVFLVAGEDKAQALDRAFGDPPDPVSPAAHVRPESGLMLVLADRGAARRTDP